MMSPSGRLGRPDVGPYDVAFSYRLLTGCLLTGCGGMSLASVHDVALPSIDGGMPT